MQPLTQFKHSRISFSLPAGWRDSSRVVLTSASGTNIQISQYSNIPVTLGEFMKTLALRAEQDLKSLNGRLVISEAVQHRRFNSWRNIFEFSSGFTPESGIQVHLAIHPLYGKDCFVFVWTGRKELYDQAKGDLMIMIDSFQLSDTQ